MINPWGLTSDEMEEVQIIMKSQTGNYPSLIWLTALANMECAIYEDVLLCTDTTKADAFYYHNIISDAVRRHIGNVNKKGHDET